MNCRTCQQQFNRHLDQPLVPAQKEELESHLALCQKCRDLCRSLQTTTWALRSQGASAIPRDLATRAMGAALSRGRRPASFLDRFIGIAKQTALAATMATALVWAGLLITETTSSASSYPPSTDAHASLGADPIEVALTLWMTEALDDEE